ncbi:DUF2188 domain-containing protein [Aeromonas dhakensis]|uniref:DUF2188 domain-containing protein n=1 Tax=Aeromonas dhakensis TaxID=196024 RepID=UPI003BA1B429
MDNYHLTKAMSGGWVFRKANSSTNLLSASTKSALIEQVRAYMQGRTGSVKIHKEDGTIEEERTYPRAADPVRSKG